MKRIQITPSLAIDEKEITYIFLRASGPGGQNVNKVATAVQLRFDLRRSTCLSPEIRIRLGKLAGSRLSSRGFLTIEAKRYRTQEQNRTDATRRFIALVQKALAEPKQRRPTRPSAGIRARRLEAKKQRGAIKRIRQDRPNSNE